MGPGSWSTVTGVLILAGLFLVAALVVPFVAAAGERVRWDESAALARQARDFDEPTRAEVEETWLFEAPEFVDLGE